MIRIIWLFIILVPYYLYANDEVRIEAERRAKSFQWEHNKDIKELNNQKHLTENRSSFNITLPDVSEYLDDRVCFGKDNFSFSGNREISERRILKVFNNYSNNCLTLAFVHKFILSDILELYHKKGFFLVKISLKDNDIQADNIRIEIEEGLLEEVDFDENILPKKKVEAVFKKKINKAINLRYIEQSIENLMASGKYDISMDFIKGSKDGYMILQLKTKKIEGRKLATIRLTNNYNKTSKNSFPNKRLETNISYQNGDTFLANDFYSIYMGIPLKEYMQDSYQGNLGFTYNLPRGYWNFSFSNSTDGYYSRIKMLYDSYSTEGLSAYSFFEASRYMVRNNIYNLKIFSKLNYYATFSYLASEMLEASSYELYFSDIGFDYQYFHNRFSFTSTFSYTYGHPFGDEKVGDNNYYIPYNLFSIINFDYRLNIPIKYWLSFRSNFSSQYSKQTLYPIKDFTVIGTQGVRGYTGISSDFQSGFTIQNEVVFNWYYPYMISKFYPLLSLLLAVDMGGSIDTEDMIILNEGGKPLWATYIELRFEGKLPISIGYGRPLKYTEYVPKNHHMMKLEISYKL